MFITLNLAVGILINVCDLNFLNKFPQKIISLALSAEWWRQFKCLLASGMSHWISQGLFTLTAICRDSNQRLFIFKESYMSGTSQFTKTSNNRLPVGAHQVIQPRTELDTAAK